MTALRIRVGPTQVKACMSLNGKQIGSATGMTSMARALVPRGLTLWAHGGVALRCQPIGLDSRGQWYSLYRRLEAETPRRVSCAGTAREPAS